MNEEIVEKARMIIKKDIKRYIESDGGKIEVSKFENGILYVKLGGACKYCPAISLTMKGTVEKILLKEIPEIKSVQPIF